MHNDSYQPSIAGHFILLLACTLIRFSLFLTITFTFRIWYTGKPVHVKTQTITQHTRAVLRAQMYAPVIQQAACVYVCVPTSLKQRQEHSHSTRALRCTPECLPPSCSRLPVCVPTTLKQRQEHSHGTHSLRCVPECTRPSCSRLPVCVPTTLKQRQEHSHGTHSLRCVPECTRLSCSRLPVCVCQRP